MPLLYKNFEEFVEKNKSVFEFIGKKNSKAKNNNLGIFRAIWEARQPEIDGLREENKKESTERKKEKSLYELRYKTLEAERNKFKEVISFLEKNSSSLEERLDTLEREHMALQKRRRELDDELVETSSKNLRLESLVKEMHKNQSKLKEENKAARELVQKKMNEIESRDRQLKKAQDMLEKQAQKIADHKDKMTKFKANERVYSIDAERLKEELSQNIKHMTEQNEYVEKLKAYIERYKENSIILQEQVQKAKVDAKKSKARNEKTVSTISEVEGKLKEFQIALTRTSEENHELTTHNQELQKRLLMNKKELNEKNERLDSLKQTLERGETGTKSLKEKIETLQAELFLQKQETEKAHKRTEMALEEKDKVQAELNWMNDILQGIGNKIKTTTTNTQKSSIRDSVNDKPMDM